MALFRDLFSGHRRRVPRVAVCWPVDLQVQETGQCVSFQTCDLSTSGVRLEGGTTDQVRGLLSPDGRTRMRLRVPGCELPLEIEAELRWGMGDPLRTGWQFVRLGHQAERALAAYITAHPEQALP